jgi:hypothetical protein
MNYVYNFIDGFFCWIFQVNNFRIVHGMNEFIYFNYNHDDYDSMFAASYERLVDPIDEIDAIITMDDLEILYVDDEERVFHLLLELEQSRSDDSSVRSEELGAMDVPMEHEQLNVPMEHEQLNVPMEHEQSDNLSVKSESGESLDLDDTTTILNYEEIGNAQQLVWKGK